MTNPTFQPVQPEGDFVIPPPPAAPVRPPVRPRAGIGWVNVALAVALVVAVGGAAFAAGRMTAPASNAANRAGNFAGLGSYFGAGNRGSYFGAGAGGIGRGAAGGAGASIQGTVTAISPTSITIMTSTGQSVTLSLSSTTTYHQEQSAAVGDVTTGGTVIVRLGFGGGTGTSGASPTVSDITIVPQS